MKHKLIQSILVVLSILALTFSAAGILPASAAGVTTTHAQTNAPAAAVTNALLHFQSGGHIFGFRSSGFYVTNAAYALRVQFIGANQVAPQSDMPTTATTNATPELQRVTYSNLWDGITLAYDAVSDGLAQSWYYVEPGADVSDIRLFYNGTVRVNADGTLTTAFETGTMTESAPIAWQEINGRRVPVKVAFRTWEDALVGFRIGAYDPTRPLFIDPTLTWNTFLGGTGNDYGNGIAVDGSGNFYVTGHSTATWGAPLRAFGGGSYDAFVAKLDPSGNLLWNTFLGGTGNDYGIGIAVDGDGNIYVTGTSAATWQGASAPLRAYTSGNDAFVAKLDSGGNLLWNTFLGGTSDDSGRGIVVNGSGNIYVIGDSTATWQGDSVPVHAYAGMVDAFAVKLDSSGNLLWNTFIGGTGYDTGFDGTIDGSGNIYVTGFRDNGFDDDDAFAAKLDPSGNLLWNTFLGGTGSESGNSIAVDGSGNVYVIGYSNDTWQGDSAPLRAYTSGYDAFVAKLNPSGSLLWNTFLGGTGSDSGLGITMDGSGAIHVIGRSNSAWQGDSSPLRAYTNDSDAFAAKLDTNGSLLWNTFLGGTGFDDGRSIALDGNGNLYVTGTSDDAWQDDTEPLRAYTNGYDAFAAKFPANYYRVTYDGNGNDGGSVPTDSHWYSTGDTVGVQFTPLPTMTGYSFDAWNTAADGSGIDYAPSDTFTIAADTTLYAQWKANIFNDVPEGHWAKDFIERLYLNQITGGCGGGNYCPDTDVNRAMMAVFVLRAAHGLDFTPPPATGTVFADVPADGFAAVWIEQLAAEGITGGCGGGKYCPNNPVTRAQMAVFLIKAMYGVSYTPPDATGTVFTDVPADGFAAAFIEQLVADGITGGCGGGNFCPNKYITRAEMAVFLVAAFNLP